MGYTQVLNFVLKQYLVNEEDDPEPTESFFGGV
jgi:hypothetical protein